MNKLWEVRFDFFNDRHNLGLQLSFSCSHADKSAQCCHDCRKHAPSGYCRSTNQRSTDTRYNSNRNGKSYSASLAC